MKTGPHWRIGMPDIVAVFPSGHTAFIEVKIGRETNQQVRLAHKLTPAQSAILKRLRPLRAGLALLWVGIVSKGRLQSLASINPITEKVEAQVEWKKACTLSPCLL